MLISRKDNENHKACIYINNLKRWPIILVQGWTPPPTPLMMLENKQYLTVTVIWIETPIASIVMRGTPEIE